MRAGRPFACAEEIRAAVLGAGRGAALMRPPTRVLTSPLPPPPTRVLTSPLPPPPTVFAPPLRRPGRNRKAILLGSALIAVLVAGLAFVVDSATKTDRPNLAPVTTSTSVPTSARPAPSPIPAPTFNEGAPSGPGHEKRNGHRNGG